MPDAPRPIYVIKKKASHGGHHGGAWKVAYADFVTAMMSLFIVLWLLNSTPQVKKAIAGYFNDPKGSGSSNGSSAAGTSESVAITKTNVEKLKEEIEKAIVTQPELKQLSKQIDITIVGEGLKIELLEDGNGTFFNSGSATLSAAGVKLIGMLASQLKVLPNSLSIEGHTDARPYAGAGDYTNWELSADRANSARRLLQQDGVGPTQITQVRGYADQQPRKPADPLDPSNRRVSMIVSWVRAPGAPASKEAGTQGAKSEEAPKQQAKDAAKPDTTRPAEPATKGKAEGKPVAAPDSAESATAATPAPPIKPGLVDRLKSMLPSRKKTYASAPTGAAASPASP